MPALKPAPPALRVSRLTNHLANHVGLQVSELVTRLDDDCARARLQAAHVHLQQAILLMQSAVWHEESKQPPPLTIGA